MTPNTLQLSQSLPLPQLSLPRQHFPYGELLLIGHDAILQKARARMLDDIGFRCHAPTGIAAPQDLNASRFIVAVLCHTLKPPYAAHLATVLHHYSPHTPVLRLTKGSRLETGCFDSLLVPSSPMVLSREIKRLGVLGVLRRVSQLVENGVR